MNYTPLIKSAVSVHSVMLRNGKYKAVLLDEIEQEGLIKYKYILIIYRTRTQKECLFVTSEVNFLAEDEGRESYFLCVFPGNSHINLSDSIEWGDMVQFETKALQIAEEYIEKFKKGWTDELVL